jgi:hypothetical protein
VQGWAAHVRWTLRLDSTAPPEAGAAVQASKQALLAVLGGLP